jgi:hypothetical protein
MSALPPDIIRATRRARVVTREDTAIRDAFPDGRDQVIAPEPGFFESASDAAAVLELKAQLTGVFRRRFAVIESGIRWIDPGQGVPSFTLADGELGFNGPALLTRWRLDLNTERTEMELVG